MRNLKLFTAPITAILIAVVAVVAVGCGSDGPDSTTEGNATDSAFVKDMTLHHQGAIEMAEVAQDRAEHPEIKTLAGQVIDAQKGEIAVMTRIEAELRAHGATGNSMGMSDAEMGMGMDPAELRDSNPFDRAFIDMMIPHHLGAITMARSELANGSHRALRTIASNIIKAQTQEIEQMQSWREQWYGSRLSVGKSAGDTPHSMDDGSSMGSDKR